MLVRQCKLCKSVGKVLCNGGGGALCQTRQTETHGVPQRAICSQVSVTQGEGRAPASFENSLLCRNSAHSRKVYDSFGAVAAEIELCALRGCKSMYREDSMGVLPSELIIWLQNR